MVSLAVLGAGGHVGVGHHLCLGGLHPAGRVVGRVPGPVVAGSGPLTLSLATSGGGGGDVVTVRDVIPEIVHTDIIIFQLYNSRNSNSNFFHDNVIDFTLPHLTSDNKLSCSS